MASKEEIEAKRIEIAEDENKKNGMRLMVMRLVDSIIPNLAMANEQDQTIRDNARRMLGGAIATCFDAGLLVVNEADIPKSVPKPGAFLAREDIDPGIYWVQLEYNTNVADGEAYLDHPTILEVVELGGELTAHYVSGASVIRIPMKRVSFIRKLVAPVGYKKRNIT